MMKIPTHSTELFASQHDLSTLRPTQNDVSLFESELRQATATSTHDQHQGMLSKASELFTQSQKDEHDVNNVMRKASHSSDPLIINKVNVSLSNYYMENMLNTKVVSKAVQSLDKLTNLQ